MPRLPNRRGGRHSSRTSSPGDGRDGVTHRLLLVRHGLTDWNREGRFQGHLDPALSQEGLAQAALLARRLADSPDYHPARIVSSSLARALETAQAISAAAEAAGEVEPEPGMMEVGQGEWEGKTHTELQQTDADRFLAWQHARGFYRQPPGGESLKAAMQRVQGAVDAAVTNSEHADRWPLCLVAHGGSLRLAASHLLDLDLEHAWELEMDNACLCVLDRATAADVWRLVTWNDTTHLLGRAPVHEGEDEGEPIAL
jgi:broad specificity phosphatase PhoE